MNTNNIAKIVKFLTNGQTATYTEGDGLQGIDMLEYGETYLFISKNTSLPYTNCDDGDIDFRFSAFKLDTPSNPEKLKVQQDGKCKLNSHTAEVTMVFNISDQIDNGTTVEYSFDNFATEDNIKTATHLESKVETFPLSDFLDDNENSLGKTLTDGQNAFVSTAIYFRDPNLKTKVYEDRMVVIVECETCDFSSVTNQTNGVCNEGYLGVFDAEGCLQNCLSDPTNTTTPPTSPPNTTCPPVLSGGWCGYSNLYSGRIIYYDPPNQTCIKHIYCVPGCPTVDTPIQMSDGSEKPAGGLVVGDKVSTQHEITMESGEHEITYVGIKLSETLKLSFEDGGTFTCSPSHQFYHKNQWVAAYDLVVDEVLQGRIISKIEDNGVQDVVIIQVEDAHTYVADEFLSHNKVVLPTSQPTNPPPITSAAPTTTLEPTTAAPTTPCPPHANEPTCPDVAGKVHVGWTKSLPCPDECRIDDECRYQDIPDLPCSCDSLESSQLMQQLVVPGCTKLIEETTSIQCYNQDGSKGTVLQCPTYSIVAVEEPRYGCETNNNVSDPQGRCPEGYRMHFNGYGFSCIKPEPLTTAEVKDWKQKYSYEAQFLIDLEEPEGTFATHPELFDNGNPNWPTDNPNYNGEMPCMYDGDDYYFNGCDIGGFGDGQSVWEQLVSSDFNDFPFPSPCKYSCGCDPTRSYYFENDPEAFAEQCLDRNGSPNGECVGEIITSVEAYPMQMFEGTPTIYSQFGTPVGSAPVYGYIFRDASLCGIPVAKYNTADVKAVESLNVFRDEPFPKNITAAPICSQE